MGTENRGEKCLLQIGFSAPALGIDPAGMRAGEVWQIRQRARSRLVYIRYTPYATDRSRKLFVFKDLTDWQHFHQIQLSACLLVKFE